MLNWLFKKKPAATSAPAPVVAPAPARPPAPDPAAVEAERAARTAQWAGRLGEAQGRDDALLAIAADAAAPVEVKIAAIEGLVGEGALKEAERLFRSHDRRVLRIAKQRLAAATATRVARESATQLFAQAEALQREVVIPANRLVALDRDWQALDATLLEAGATERFTTLTRQLTATMHDRAEREAAEARWSGEVRAAAARLQTVALAVAQGVEARDALTAAADAAVALQAAPPEGHAEAEPVEALNAGRLLASQVEARLALLAEFDALPEATPADAENAADRWRALPPVADSRIGQALEHRWSVWLRAHLPPAPAPAEPPPPKEKKPRPKPAAPDPEAVARSEALLAQAEAALAEGHLAEAHQHLTALDTHAVPAQRGRLQGLWAEHGRLRGWQQWGGGRARDDLVAEAEALAAATSAPDAKVAARQQSDAIDGLRKRWKEIDRTGGASSQALWQRFDAALQTAYGPVAAAQAKLDAERQANLEARQALLGTLEETPDGEPAVWHERVRALDTFQLAWRKLGPIEHTVPHKAREALVARWRAAIERIEAPLAAARREAEGVREALIERAREIAADRQGRDTVIRVRELQARWQEHAKSVPLARASENALWSRFKAETDAVFAQRDAAYTARDEALRTHLMSAEALVAQLAALAPDTPAADVRRTLAEVDTAWRQGGELPRADGPRIEAAYRAARDAAQALIAAGAHRQWQGAMDALLARRALCVRREADGASDALNAEWDALPPAPPLWGKALAARWAQGPSPVTTAADDWLLQLEMALDLPSPDDVVADRRAWKLRAMKAALDSRGGGADTTVGVDDGVALLLGQAGLSASQQARFDAVLAGLRDRKAQR